MIYSQFFRDLQLKVVLLLKAAISMHFWRKNCDMQSVATLCMPRAMRGAAKYLSALATVGNQKPLNRNNYVDIKKFRKVHCWKPFPKTEESD